MIMAKRCALSAKSSRLTKLSALASLCACSLAQASGFKLTEQSLNGTALNSAYIAGAYGADSSYYNPANMGFDEANELEVNGTMIFIPEFDFTTAGRDKGEISTGNGAALGPNRPAGPAIVEGRANTTLAFAPKIFFKTKPWHIGSFLRTNFGLSVTTPSGLSMDWDGEGGEFLDKVGIMMIETNPVVSITLWDRLGLAAGARIIYGSGDFGNTLYVPYRADNAMGMGLNISGTTKVQQQSKTSAVGYGYNVALTLKPTPSTTLAATYRSKVHFDMKGKLSATSHIDGGILAGKGTVDMQADLLLSTHLPDTLNVALAQRLGKLLAEFTYEHTFWGSADIFEFQYSNQEFSNAQGFNPGVENTVIAMAYQNMAGADYNAVAMGRGWKNSNAFRLGFTHFSTQNLTLMGSLALDFTPVPQGRDKFGIPDANAYMLGLGARYNLFDGRADVGLAYSLALKDNRESFIQSKDGLGQLHLVTLGAKYRF